MEDIYELFSLAADGNENAILDVIKRFTPLLKKYARKLNYEDAYYDLQLKLIEVIHSPVFSNSSLPNGQAIAYIQQSIIHEYIRLGKKHTTLEIPLNDLSDEQQHIVTSTSASDAPYNEVELKLVFDILSPLERDAITRIVLNHDTAAQLARELGCTRQSVNQAKHRGLQKLKYAYSLRE